MKIHPLVARLVDTETLEKMKTHPVGAEADAGAAMMSEPRGNV